MDLGLLKYDRLKASSYVKLLVMLSRKNVCVNVRNIGDNKCFLWSILASLHPIGVNPDRLTNYLTYEMEINMQGIQYPVKVNNLPKFEKQNPRMVLRRTKFSHYELQIKTISQDWFHHKCLPVKNIFDFVIIVFRILGEKIY